MAKFTIIAAVLYVVGKAISYFSPNSIFSALELLGTLGLIVALPYYGLKLFRKIKGLWLWRVCNKIIVSYLFVGVIPITILVLLLWLTLRLVFGQLAALYLDDELQRIQESIRQANQEISLGYYQRAARGEAVSLLTQQANSALQSLESELGPVSWRLIQPGGSMNTAERSEESRRVSRVLAALPSTGGAPVLRSIPDRALKGFTGLVDDEDGTLYFRSISPLKSGAALYYTCLELPVTPDLLDRIRKRTSVEMSPPKNRPPTTGFSEFVTGAQVNYISFVSVWDLKSGRDAYYLYALRAPMRTVYNHYFTETQTLGKRFSVIFYLLGALFILVEIGTLVVAIAIGRSITRTIHGLDAATAAIRQGNFEYRIQTRNRDQLEAMAVSFNSMADSIVTLMSQVSEKQRLDKEIEIAREVQSKLFPQKLPSIKAFQLAAACLPARQVSGDYYDFIPFGANTLDVVIGDISGKGISAALLMASLQSSIRTIVSYQAMGTDGQYSVAKSVADVNRQLYHQTSPDKFATLVLSRFNATDLSLTYCNAGHNPPLVISQGQIRHLSKGGMVAGLFEDPEYDEETITLSPRDVIVYYTDGIVEAENPGGEQFGEDRLADLLVANSFLTADDLQALILDQLSSWVAGGDQRDDMTVVVVKVEG